MEPRLWLWRYKTESRWRDVVNFMADAETCDSLIGILRAGRSQRTLPARPLRVEHDPTGVRASFVWFAKLRAGVVSDDPELKQMHLATDGDAVTLAVHPSFVEDVVAALESVKTGGWDFGLGPETRRKALAGDRDRASLQFLFWQPLRGTV